MLRLIDHPSDERLATWAREVLSGVEVSLAAPARAVPAGRGVNLYLLELRPRPPLRTAHRDPLQLWLRYLVSSWAPDPAEAHAMLLELVFAAMDEPDFEVDLEPPEAQVWLALDVPPGPCFRLSLPQRRDRPQPVTKPVLRPLVVTGSGMGSLAGWVRTPDGLAIAGASVELPDMDRRSLTDARGHFQIDALPVGGVPLGVRVRAKGREVWASVGTSDDREAVLIKLDPLEESDGGVPHP